MPWKHGTTIVLSILVIIKCYILLSPLFSNQSRTSTRKGNFWFFFGARLSTWRRKENFFQTFLLEIKMFTSDWNFQNIFRTWSQWLFLSVSLHFFNVFLMCFLHFDPKMKKKSVGYFSRFIFPIFMGPSQMPLQTVGYPVAAILCLSWASIKYYKC